MFMKTKEITEKDKISEAISISRKELERLTGLFNCADSEAADAIYYGMKMHQQLLNQLYKKAKSL